MTRPEWLSDAAAAEWDRIIPELAKTGAADPADEASLAAYCEAVARLRIATGLVNRLGLVRKAGDDLVRNPAVTQARDASYEVRMWAREFGLTPSARAVLARGGQAQPEPEEPDPGRPLHSATDGHRRG